MPDDRNGEADSLAPDRFAFSAFIDALSEAIVIVDRDGLIVEINVKAVGLFGYTRDELAGQSVATLIPERFRERHAGLQDRYNRSPHVRPMGAGTTLVALHKDGHEIPVEIGLGPFQSSGGPQVVCTIRDLTEPTHERRATSP